jgi:hypothetical protein
VLEKAAAAGLRLIGGAGSVVDNHNGDARTRSRTKTTGHAER